MSDEPKRYFELTVVYKSDVATFNCDSIDKIVANDLVKLLAQFMIVIGSLHRRVMQEEGRWVDDDIPF